jgi:Protein of unknown function (DUF2690)
MRFIARSALALLVSAAGTIATGVAVAPNASAATPATCQGSCWNGKNPNTSVCQNDAITPVPAVTYKGATVELRYSPTCRAAWARITPAFGDVMDVHNSAGLYKYEISGNSNWTWTAMVNDMNLTSRACINYGTGSGVNVCTQSY